MARTHYYDNCNGGICMQCDRCTNPWCCPQTVVCDGTNWETIREVVSEFAKEHIAPEENLD